MDRPTLTVGDIVRRDGEAYRQAGGRALVTAQRRVLAALESCRTAALGGPVERGCLTVLGIARPPIQLPRRAHNPLLIDAGLIGGTTPIPWWQGRSLRVEIV